MYVYLVVKSTEDFFSYKELFSVCANEALAKRDSHFAKKEHKEDCNFLILRKRVNRKDKVFILREHYEMAGVDVPLFERVSTSEKRLKGYVKHVSQTCGTSPNSFSIKEVLVVQE